MFNPAPLRFNAAPQATPMPLPGGYVQPGMPGYGSPNGTNMNLPGSPQQQRPLWPRPSSFNPFQNKSASPTGLTAPGLPPHQSAFPTQAAPPGPSMLPPGSGLDALANIDPSKLNPEQLAQLRKQVKSQILGQARHLLKTNPQVRAQMEQMITAAEEGKLPENVVEQMVNPFGIYDDELQGLSRSQITKIGVISTAAGFGIGAFFNNLMTSLSEKNGRSVLDGCCKFLEGIPGISGWSKAIQGYLDKIPRDGSSVNSGLLSVDGALSADQVEGSIFKNLFGPGGAYHDGMAGWVKEAIPSKAGFDRDHITKALLEARDYNRLEQIIYNRAEHFLPEHMRSIIQGEADLRHGSGLLNQLQQSVTGPYRGPKQFTLSHVNEILTQNHLVGELEKASLAGKLPKKVYDQITHALGTSYGQPMQQKIEHLLSHPQYRQAGQALRTVLELGPEANYQAVLEKIQKAPGYQPIWEKLTQQSKGLLKRPIEFKPTTSWQSIVKTFDTHGLGAQWAKTAKGGSFKQWYENMFRHFESFSSYNKPIIQERYALNTLLRKRGVGPIGRLFATVPYFLQRLFMGNRYRHLTAKPFLGFIPNRLGGMMFRLFISTMLIGFPLGAMWKTDDELKGPKFVKSLGLNLSSWLGYEVGMMAANESTFLHRFKWLNKFMFARILPPLSFTWGGLVKSLVVPSIVASLFGSAANLILSRFVGNPERVEQLKKLAKLRRDLGLETPHSKRTLSQLFHRKGAKPTPAIHQAPSPTIKPAMGPKGPVDENTTLNNPLPYEFDAILKEAVGHDHYQPYNDPNHKKHKGHVDHEAMEAWAWSYPGGH